MNGRPILLITAALIALPVSSAWGDDRWYEGRWAVQGTDCESETPAGISIFGDKVVFYSPSGSRFSMDIVGDQKEADFVELTEQSATITSREATEIGHSFLVTIDHDGADAGFAMLNVPSRPITLVAQTGFFSIFRCD